MLQFTKDHSVNGNVQFLDISIDKTNTEWQL